MVKIPIPRGVLGELLEPKLPVLPKLPPKSVAPHFEEPGAGEAGAVGVGTGAGLEAAPGGHHPHVDEAATIAAVEGVKGTALEGLGGEHAEHAEHADEPDAASHDAADPELPVEAATQPEDIQPPSTQAAAANEGVQGAPVRSAPVRARPLPFLNAQPTSTDGADGGLAENRQQFVDRFTQRLQTERTDAAFDGMVKSRFDEMAASSPLIAANGRGVGNKYRTLNAIEDLAAAETVDPQTGAAAAPPEFLPIAPSSKKVDPPADEGGKGGVLDALWRSLQWFPDRAGELASGGSGPTSSGQLLADWSRATPVSPGQLGDHVAGFAGGVNTFVQDAGKNAIGLFAEVIPHALGDAAQGLAGLTEDDWLKGGLGAAAEFLHAANSPSLLVRPEDVHPGEPQKGIAPAVLPELPPKVPKGWLGADKPQVPEGWELGGQAQLPSDFARRGEYSPEQVARLEAEGFGIPDRAPKTAANVVGYGAGFVAATYVASLMLARVGYTTRVVPEAAGPWTWARFGPTAYNALRSGAAGGLTAYVLMNENSARVSDLIQSFGPTANPLNALLATNPDDPAWLGRLKIATENLGFGFFGDMGFFVARSSALWAYGFKSGARQLGMYAIDPATNSMPGRLLGDPLPDASLTVTRGSPEAAARATTARTKLTDAGGVDVSWKYLDPPGGGGEPPAGGGGGETPPAAAAPAPMTGSAMDHSSAMAIPDDTLVEVQGYTRIGETDVSVNYNKITSAADIQSVLDDTTRAVTPKPVAAATFRETTPEDFVAARDAPDAPRPEFLTHYPAKDLAGARVHLSADGKSGYALSPDDDFLNAFNNGGAKGAGGAAVVDAIQKGAKTAEAFDGFLPDYYGQYGFKVVARVPFDDALAPANWNYDAYGRPDLVFMVYDGGERATIGSRVGSFAGYERNTVPVFSDYDSAKAAQRSAVVVRGNDAAGAEVSAGGAGAGGRGAVAPELAGVPARSGAPEGVLKSNRPDLVSGAEGRLAAVRDPRSGRVVSGPVHAVAVRKIAKEWGWPEDQVWRKLRQNPEENFGFVNKSDPDTFIAGGQGALRGKPAAPAEPAPLGQAAELPPLGEVIPNTRMSAVRDPKTGRIGVGPSHEDAIAEVLGGGELDASTKEAMWRTLAEGDGINSNFGFYENGRFQSMREGYPERIIKVGPESEYNNILGAQREVEGMRAALRDPDTGRVFTGATHNDAIDRLAQARGQLPEEVAASLPDDSFGFTFRKEPGKFYSKADAEARVADIAPGKLREIDGQLTFDPEEAIIYQMDAPPGRVPTEGLQLNDETWRALVLRRGGTALTAEEEKAYRTVLETTGKKLQDVAGWVSRNPEAATPENLFEFRRLHAEYAAMEQVILGHPERADALLAQFKLTATNSPVDQAAEAANIIMRNGGIDMNRDLAAKIAHAGHNELPAFVEQTAGQKARGVISELWYGLQLTPRLAGRAVHEVAATAVHLLDAQFAAVWGKVLGTPGARVSDAMIELSGYFTSFSDSLVAARQAFKTGWPGWGVRDVEIFSRGGLNPDLLGVSPNAWYYRPLQWVDAGVRTPGKLSAFVQEFFQHEVYMGTIKRGAYQQARSELASGILTSDQVGPRVQQLLEASLSGDAIAASLRAEARQVGEFVGFSGEPGMVAKAALQMRNLGGSPMISWVGRYIAPFANRPLNGLKYAFEHTPLAPLSTEFRRKVAAGGATRDLALGQITTGVVLMGTGVELALQGILTGPMPEDPKEREIWRRSHKTPYSIKIGETEIPLAVLGSLGELLKWGTQAGAFILNSDGEPSLDALADQGFEGTFLAAGNLAMEPTFVRDIADFLAAVRDPESEESKNWVDRQIAKNVPSALGATAKMLSPEERYVDSLWDDIQSRVPGLRAGLPIRRDRWGRPMSYVPDTAPYTDAFFGVYGYKPTVSAIDQVMLKEKWYLATPSQSWTVRGQQGVRASSAAYSEYMEAQGQFTPTEIAKMLTRPGALTTGEFAQLRGATNYMLQRYGNHNLLDTLDLVVSDKHPLSVAYKRQTTPDARQKFIRAIADDYSDAAKLAVIGRHPELVQQAKTMMTENTSKVPSPATIIRPPAAAQRPALQ